MGAAGGPGVGCRGPYRAAAHPFPLPRSPPGAARGGGGSAQPRRDGSAHPLGQQLFQPAEEAGPPPAQGHPLPREVSRGRLRRGTGKGRESPPPRGGVCCSRGGSGGSGRCAPSEPGKGVQGAVRVPSGCADWICPGDVLTSPRAFTLLGIVQVQKWGFAHTPATRGDVFVQREVICARAHTCSHPATGWREPSNSALNLQSGCWTLTCSLAQSKLRCFSLRFIISPDN